EGEVETTAGVSVGSVHLNPRYAAIGANPETEAPTDTEASYGDGDIPTDTVPLQAVPGDEDGKTGHEDTKPLRTGSGEGEEDDDLGEEVGKRSFLGWIITGLVIIALTVGGFCADSYVSNQYSAADDDGRVSLYRGHEPGPDRAQSSRGHHGHRGRKPQQLFAGPSARVHPRRLPRCGRPHHRQPAQGGRALHRGDGQCRGLHEPDRPCSLSAELVLGRPQ